MKTAIILHGMPSKEGYYDPNRESQSNEHWLPWLQHQLLLKDILAQAPEMPKPYEPNYGEWLKVFDQFLIDENTILIGHSLGGGFLIRWLSENNVKVGKVILVAPWIDTKKVLVTGFFDFKIDPNLVNKTNGIVIFGSDNDENDIKESIKALMGEVSNISYREFQNMGHFVFSSMGKKDFPELLEEVEVRHG